jgi:chorismate mutase
MSSPALRYDDEGWWRHESCAPVPPSERRLADASPREGGLRRDDARRDDRRDEDMRSLERHRDDAPPHDGALADLRDRVVAIDAQLVALVAERQRVAARIGAVKRAAAQPVLDLAREAAVLRRVAEEARHAGVDEEDVRELWRKLLAMARRVQAADGEAAP